MGNRKERITELESEVARLTDELAAVQHVEDLEAQAAKLRAEIAAARARITPNYQLGGYISSGQTHRIGESGPEIVTLNAPSSTTATITNLRPRRDDPPDMGVAAIV
jgi:ribosome-interacting GTPase 1